MSDTLYISKAGSLSWKYVRENGSIHEFTNNLDANFLYAEAQNYYNCDRVQNEKRDAQLYNCDDVVQIQFEYSRVNCDPMLIVYDKDGLPVKVIYESGMLNSSTIYGYTFVFSDPEFTCGECHTMKLWSNRTGLPTDNLFDDGQDGTMEDPLGITGMGSGGSNTFAQSNVEAVAGTYSMVITSPASPTDADRLIAYGTTNINLSTGGIYKAEAWVFLHVAVPFITGQDIYIDITGAEGLAGNYWTDATILQENRYNYGTNGTGTWVYIQTTFQVNADTSGQVAIVSMKKPDGVSIMYVDSISLKRVNSFLEAESEPFLLKENHECTTLIKYTAIPGREHEQFGLYYTNDPMDDFYGFENTIRLRLRAFQFNMVDDDYTTQDNSVGTAEVVQSRLIKQYVVHTDQLPVHMLEKLPMAMKHDNVKFYNQRNYVQMVCLTKTFNPTYADPYQLTGTQEFVMRPKEYDYSNSNCS